MNNKELQAVRKLLFLTPEEAAEYIGEVSTRTWQRWEKGDFNIPDDVALKMEKLMFYRAQELEKIEAQAMSAELSIAYYAKFSEYAADHRDAHIVDWKVSQSIAAEMYCNDFAKLS